MIVKARQGNKPEERDKTDRRERETNQIGERETNQIHTLSFINTIFGA